MPILILSPSPSILPFRVFRVFRGSIQIHLRQRDELAQPPVRNYGVVVQQHQVFPTRRFQALVDCGGEAEVFSVAHDRHGHRGDILDAREIGARPVG